MKISQREARRLRKRVDALERAFESQRQIYSQEWFMATDIGRENLDLAIVIRTARRLKHAVVCIADDNGNGVRFMALPHPKLDV